MKKVFNISRIADNPLLMAQYENHQNFRRNRNTVDKRRYKKIVENTTQLVLELTYLENDITTVTPYKDFSLSCDEILKSIAVLSFDLSIFTATERKTLENCKRTLEAIREKCY